MDKIVATLSIVLIFSAVVFSVTLEDIREVSKENPEKAFELLLDYLKSHPEDKKAQELGKVIAAKKYLIEISQIADAVKKEDVYQLIRSMASLTHVSIKTMDYIEVVFPHFYDALRDLTMKLDESAFRTCSIVPYRVREPEGFHELVVDTYFASPLEFDPKKIEELKCMNLPRIKSNIKKYLENFLGHEDYYIKILNLSDMLLIEPPHATDLRLYYDLSYKLATVNTNGLTPEDFKDLLDEYEKIHLKKEKLVSKLREIYIRLSEKYDFSFCKDESICPKIEGLKNGEKDVEEKEEVSIITKKSSTPSSLMVHTDESTELHVSLKPPEKAFLTGSSSKITFEIAKTTSVPDNRIKTAIYVSILSLVGAVIISLIIIRKKDPLRRIRKIKRKIAMNPADSSLHFTLAQLYEEIGRTEDAVKEYKLASKLFNAKQAPSENGQKEP